MKSNFCGRSIACLALFWATFAVAAASAQSKWKTADIPDSLRQNASKVTRKRDLHMRVKSMSGIKIELHEVTTYFEYPTGKHISIGGVEDKFNKVKAISLLLYDAQGKVLFESKKSDIKKTNISGSEFSYSDTAEKFISTATPATPFTAEIRQTFETQNTIGFPDFDVQLPGEAVENATAVLESPPDFLYKWKSINCDVQPTTTLAKDGYAVKTWTIQNRRALPQEALSNPLEGSGIIFTPEQFLWFDRNLNMADWKQFGKCIFDLNDNRSALSPEFKSEILKMTSACKSDREKIGVLYAFLQKFSRYVSIQIGIGGWQTLEAAFVEKNRFGDCKALSNFMKAMLQTVGIEARLVLICGDNDGSRQLGNDIVQNVFNHMIAYVPAEDLWLECTSQFDPPGWLSTFTSGRDALVLGPEGGTLLRTPTYTQKDNKSGVSGRIEVREDGTAFIQTVSLHEGTRQDGFRWLAFNEKGEMLQKRFVSMLEFGVSHIARLEIRPDSLNPQTRVLLECTSGSIATRTGKRLFVSPNKLNPLGRSLKKQENRSHPVFIGESFAFADTIQLIIPAGFAAEAIPRDTKINAPFGSYELAVAATDGVITCVRKAEFLRVNAPPSAYESVRQFYADVSKADAQPIVLVDP